MFLVFLFLLCTLEVTTQHVSESGHPKLHYHLSVFALSIPEYELKRVLTSHCYTQVMLDQTCLWLSIPGHQRLCFIGRQLHERRERGHRKQAGLH